MLKKKKYAKWDNDDEAPDWGDLKKREQEDAVQLKKVEKVRLQYVKSYFIRNAANSV